MKTKMSILSALLFSCMLMIVGSIIYFTVQSRIVSAKESELRNQAQAIAQYYADFVSDFGTAKDNGRWISAFLQSDQKVVVISRDMRTQLQVGKLPIHAPNQYFMKVNHIIQGKLRENGFRDGAYTQAPVFGDNPKPQPIAYIQLFSGMYTVHHYMDTLLAMLLFCFILGLMIAGIGGYWITRLSLNPLTKLVASIERISALNLHERVHLHRTDPEITRVARTFNQMAERLERAFAQQEQFVADASHEIKTPLTAILGHSDRIARWGDTRPEVLQSSTGVIQKETLRLQKLVDDLLTLARRHESDSCVQSYSNADEVVREVVDDYRPVYDQIHIYADLHAMSKCKLAPELLKRVIVNIVANAVKFTPPGGSINILTRQKETSVIIEVRDTGCGIPKEHLPHIFDRFYRVDQARERRQGGNGLGMAIVKEILLSHGGGIDVTSDVGKGTSVCVQIPRYE